MGLLRWRFAVPLGLMLLTACGQDTAPDQAEGGAASGEVLPGSLSDDMIATDTLRSQAPQLEVVPDAAGGGVTPVDPAAAEGEEAAPEADTETATPAEAPAAE